MIRKHILLIPVALSYAILAWFVYFVVNPLCYNIFQQPAFVLTADFFWTKVSAPGGLAEYFQTFIDQFTMFRFWGTVFLVAELFLTAVLVNCYIRKTVGGNAYTSLITHILAVAIAIVAWTDVKYPFAINMQVLLLIAIMNLHQVLSRFDWETFVTPLLAMAIYHACGAVALYVFAVCGVLNYAFMPDKRKLASMVGAVVVAALWPLIVYRFLLPIKPNAAFFDMRPQEMKFTTFKFSGVLFLPLVSPIFSLLIGIAISKYVREQHIKMVAWALFAVIVLGTVGLQMSHDKKLERLSFKMEVAAYSGNWDWILNCMKKNDFLKEYVNYNQWINFYYNMALAAKGQLADKMFSYPQLLGINGLFVDEPMATVICLPMTILFDNMGFSTNALHYAFEAQTTYENSHYLMRYVIDELLIIGDYSNAKKYLDKYEHVMLSKRFVEDRNNYIVHSPETDFNRDKVDGIRKRHPKADFYLGNSQYDVLQVVMSDKNNAFATQYLLTSALLQNNLNLFLSLLLDGHCKVNYNNLPRSYQEAVLLYRALSKESRADVENIQIQPYIVDQFKVFQQIATKDGNIVRNIVIERFPNSYWKYFFVDNPEITGLRVSN